MIVGILRVIKQIYKRLFGIFVGEPPVSLSSILGFDPGDKTIYDLAFTHRSLGLTNDQGQRLNNERLEYLGDSVLTTAVNHHIYRLHPDWSEGQMTNYRAVLVRRTVNNAVARRMGLHKLLRIKGEGDNIGVDVYGNALEALVGAIFLDKGYVVAEHFVITRIIPLFSELQESLVDQTTNYRSQLLEWSQRQHKVLEYRMLQEPKKVGATFVCAVYIDGRRCGVGRGTSKKESQRDAAHQALLLLGQEGEGDFVPNI